MATATIAFIPNGNIVISYGQVEIPSVESSDMSSNMAQAQAGWLWGKVLALTWLDFFPVIGLVQLNSSSKVGFGVVVLLTNGFQEV
jgi:hypothetical protein